MIFGKKQRASPEVIAAMARAAEKFAQKWSYPSPPDAQWVENWADLLHDLTPEEIDTAAALFLKDFHSPPLPAHFVEVRDRIRAGRKLDEPFVSQPERIAFMILTSDEFAGGGVSLSDLSRGCMIASVIANMKAHQGIVPMDHPGLHDMLMNDLRYIGDMSHDWLADAKDGKGYWAGLFDPKRPPQDHER